MMGAPASSHVSGSVRLRGAAAEEAARAEEATAAAPAPTAPAPTGDLNDLIARFAPTAP